MSAKRRRVSWLPAFRTNAAISGSRSLSSSPLTNRRRSRWVLVAWSNSNSVGDRLSSFFQPYSFPRMARKISQDPTLRQIDIVGTAVTGRNIFEQEYLVYKTAQQRVIADEILNRSALRIKFLLYRTDKYLDLFSAHNPAIFSLSWFLMSRISLATSIIERPLEIGRIVILRLVIRPIQNRIVCAHTSPMSSLQDTNPLKSMDHRDFVQGEHGI